jgi:hypothetical protein
MSARERTSPAVTGPAEEVPTGNDSSISLARGGPVGKGTEIATLEQKLAQFDERQVNLLNPITTLGLDIQSSYLQPVVAVIAIRPDAGETYQSRAFHKKDEQSLSALGLAKLAKAGNVRWEYSREAPGSRTVTKGELGDRSFTHVRIVWEACGAIRLPNGEWYAIPKSRAIDTMTLAEELEDIDRKSLEKGWNKDRQTGRVNWTEADIPSRVRGQLLQIRANLEQLAETKAQNRVLRALLGVQTKYTGADLAKPFVVPQMLYRPDVTDPMQLERVRLEGSRAAEDLYGSPLSSTARGSVAALPSPETSGSERSTGSPAYGEGAEKPEGNEETGDRSATPPAEGNELRDSHPGDEPSAGGPERPRSDPIVETGEHKGKHWSELAVDDPRYLEVIVAETGAKVKRELAQRWLDWARPSLGN